jgi:hypothetical protein
MLVHVGFRNTNYYFDFADCQKETKYRPVSCPNFKSLEFKTFNETHLSVTFLPVCGSCHFDRALNDEFCIEF